MRTSHRPKCPRCLPSLKPRPFSVIWILLTLGLSSSLGYSADLFAKRSDLSLLLPTWNRFYTLSTEAGYKDNLLLGPNHREVGGFNGVIGDFILWRRPVEDRREFHVLLNGSYRHYWANRSVEHESEVLILSRYSHPISSSWEWVSEFEGAYFDQVIDATLVDTAILRQQLKGMSQRLSSGLRWKVGPHSSIQLSPLITRLWLSSPFDNHSEYGGTLGWTESYGARSEWKVDYTGRHRTFDSLTETTLTGSSIPGATRGYQRHSIQLTDKHYWDDTRRWSTLTRLAGEIGSDDGAGYWDYLRFRVQEGIQWSGRQWDFRLDVGWLHDSFPNQSISTSTSRERTRSEITGSSRIERRFGEFTKAYLEFRHDQSMASDPLERFVANTYIVGFLWDF